MNVRGPDHFLDRRDDRRLERFHAGRAGLADDDVAVAVEHQAGKAVGFAVHEPIEGLRINALAQGQRDLQSMPDQGLAWRIGRVPAEDAGADQRVRIDVGVAQEAVVIATTRHNAPGSKPVSGVRAVSTSLLKIQRWPAASRLSSRGLSRSSGRSLAVGFGHRPGRSGHGCFRRRAAAFRYIQCILSDPAPPGSTCNPPPPPATATRWPAKRALTCASTPAIPCIGIRGAQQALELARRLDKPILLSVGYSACHWCHVMAHESFEDPATAARMNELFVNIKVDREERPDLDRIYQTAHQVMNQAGGGWPLTVFLEPDSHRPFFSGTYFPKEQRYGMPSFVTVLEKVAEYYQQRRKDLRDYGDKLVTVLGQLQPPPDAGTEPLSREPLQLARATLEREFDGRFGGFGDAPKFPHPTNLEFLLRTWRATAAGDDPDLQALYMATLTLTRMAEGGIYDQVGGGFCRYSVDPYWMIPHFEKMLYDNAQLLGVYAQAAVATGEPLFRRIATETADWMLRDLRSPGRRLPFDPRCRLRRTRGQVLRLDARAGARAAHA